MGHLGHALSRSSGLDPVNKILKSNSILQYITCVNNLDQGNEFSMLDSDDKWASTDSKLQRLTVQLQYFDYPVPGWIM